MNIKNYNRKAEVFQILSHPVRLQILDELRKREACVCHLQAVTGRPQAYVSQQLQILRAADLVEDEKDGQNVYYHLKSDALGSVGPQSHPSGCTCPFCIQEN